MTQEDKQLLLKDLCARLPYEVKIRTNEDDESYTLLAIHPNKDIAVIGLQFDDVFATSKIKIEDIKPYLRPMSSMTEDECITLSKLIPYETDVWKYIKTPVPLYIANTEQFDFFHSHHLDWRGLISKGLAIEVTEVNNPYKE